VDGAFKSVGKGVCGEGGAESSLQIEMLSRTAKNYNNDQVSDL